MALGWPWGGLGVALGGFADPLYTRLFGQRLPALHLHLHHLNTRSGTSREKAQETQRGTAAAEVKTVLTQRRRDAEIRRGTQRRKKEKALLLCVPPLAAHKAASPARSEERRVGKE